MKLRIFKARDGDCLLVTGSGGTHVLVDGGRATSYEDHLAAELGALHANGEQLELVCVSHIDEDHISGVLRMLDHKVAWKVHRFQVAGDNPGHPAPGVPEPPEIANIWHNGFSDSAGDNVGEIVDQLATRTAYLSLSDATTAPGERLRSQAGRLHGLILGEESALKLRQRIGARQLGIPINAPCDGRVMGLFEEQQPFAVGELTVHMIGPYFEDLETLREKWNTWLDDHTTKVEEIREQARADEAALGLSGIDAWLHRLRLLETGIGNVEELTPPNVASIMFLIEAEGRRLLMTGDGGWDVILSGLEHAGLLQAGDGLHVDVFKVPHHGSEDNTSAELTRRITADHYLFCANGAHHNPDEEVVRAYLESRLGSGEQRSPNPEAGRPFKFWFTYGPDDDLTGNQKAHMARIKALVDGFIALHPDKLRVEFVQGDFGELLL